MTHAGNVHIRKWDEFRCHTRDHSLAPKSNINYTFPFLAIPQSSGLDCVAIGSATSQKQVQSKADCIKGFLTVICEN